MTLSPEDRERIYEEEKARRETQDRIKEEQDQIKKSEQYKRNRRRMGYAALGLLVFAGLLSLMDSPKKTRAKPTQEQRDIYFLGLKQQVRAIRAIKHHGNSTWVEMPLSAFGAHLKEEAHEVATLIAHGYVAQVGESTCVHIHAGSFTDLARACAAP